MAKTESGAQFPPRPDWSPGREGGSLYRLEAICYKASRLLSGMT